MKRKTFKVLSLVTVFAIFITALTGCGKQQGNVGASSDKPVEITFWHVYSENFGAPVITEMVDAFNKSQDKIVVKEVYNPDMYPGLMQNLQAEVASGNSPSIVMIGYNYLKYFAANFNYTSPEEIVNKYFPEDKDYLKNTYLDNILSLARVDDKQIGIPFSISTPIIYYNAELFKKAGLDPDNPPKTWNEVRAAAKQITEKTGEYGFYMQEYADNWAVQGLLEGNGAEILSKDGKAAFASDKGVEAYQLLADMVLKDKSALHITADEGIQAFINGKVGMLCGSSAKIGTVSTAAKFDLRGAEFPLFDGQERRIPAGGNFLPIMAQKEEEQKAAWEFIKFIMQPEWLAKWSKNTGYLPPREDVANDPNGLKTYIEENQLMGIAFKEMSGIYSWVAFPGDVGTQAEQLFADTRDKILDGSVSVKDALTSAQDQLNKLLKEQ
ncbi:ABC transporter substrate-binding protein [Clostridium polynesiense]|uniref:ABC transporter substrate-binding protein n=1 Tax=Clostridium polynesiense TaxID=1325933 RepID=UPI00058BA3D8|nr:ABC transporter substrate-binding protein [Clostridium polynesiense]